MIRVTYIIMSGSASSQIAKWCYLSSFSYQNDNKWRLWHFDAKMMTNNVSLLPGL